MANVIASFCHGMVNGGLVGVGEASVEVVGVHWWGGRWSIDRVSVERW